MAMGFCPEAQKADREARLHESDGFGCDASEIAPTELGRGTEEIDAVSPSCLAKTLGDLSESAFRNEQDEQQPERQQGQP